MVRAFEMEVVQSCFRMDMGSDPEATVFTETPPPFHSKAGEKDDSTSEKHQ